MNVCENLENFKLFKKMWKCWKYIFIRCYKCNLLLVMYKFYNLWLIEVFFVLIIVGIVVFFNVIRVFVFYYYFLWGFYYFGLMWWNFFNKIFDFCLVEFGLRSYLIDYCFFLFGWIEKYFRRYWEFNVGYLRYFNSGELIVLGGRSEDGVEFFG